MKMKKYWILAVVSLVAIAGPAIGTVETQKPSIDKIKNRQSFLEGVFFAVQNIHTLIGPPVSEKQQKMLNMMWLTPEKVLQEILSDIKLNRKSPLDGIKEVVVLVEDIPETERYGLTRQALQTDTELRLRQYGIKVITLEKLKSNLEEIMTERNKETIKRIEDTKSWTDLLDSGHYDESLKQMKEPEKSLMESLLNEESDQLFMDSVSEYIKLNIKHYKLLDSGAGTPALFINVLPLIFEERRTVVAHVSVELRSPIGLRRDSSSVTALAILWKRGGLISRRLENLCSEVRDKVRDYVDEFINDYLAANPEVSTLASSSKTEPPQRGLIRGIIYSEDKPSALIGDRTVHEGDTIGGVKIVKIYTDRVVFEKQGTESTIIWTQKIGEVPKANWE